MKFKASLAALYVPTVAILLLSPLAARNRLERAIFDSIHAPLFAILAVALCLLLRRWFSQRIKLCAFVASCIAGVMGSGLEVLQATFGRSSSWQDGLANLLGAVAGGLWMTGRSQTAPWRFLHFLAAGACLLLAEIPPLALLTDVVVQRRQLPQIASFEGFLEMTRWHTRECRFERVETHATHGQCSLRVELAGDAKYPGPIMTDPGRDWSGYDSFRLDVWLDGEQPIPLAVKIFDTQHNGEMNDRYNQTFTLLPGPNYLTIPLSAVAAAPVDRELDLSDIRLVQFFLVNPQQPRTIFLDNLRLERR